MAYRAVTLTLQEHYFLTTDDTLLKKRQAITLVQVMSPVDFVTELSALAGE